MRLFPHSVELARRYAGRGLSVVTVSLDSAKNEATVRSFLAAQGATATENFLATSGGGAQAVEEFEIKDGSIPFLTVYDRRGRLRATISGARPEKIDQAVTELLEER